jgi:hypothetical protein
MGSHWNFIDNLLYKEREQFLILPSKIKKILMLDNSIVILVEYNIDIGDRNVICYDFKKVLKWQIPSPIEVHHENDFTGIYLRDFELYAYNRNGVEYHLNRETGEVLGSELIK